MTTEMHIEEGDWKTLQHDCERVRLMVFVAEQHVPKEEELDEWDAKSRHFIARDAQHMVMGCARLLPTGQISPSSSPSASAAWAARFLKPSFVRPKLPACARFGCMRKRMRRAFTLRTALRLKASASWKPGSSTS